ncbi:MULTISPECIES: hypothetical protein [Streptomyces]|uniref:Nitrogen fixation protein n=2 Tax=Streptomyces TaxID=1883 RepID=A0A100Y9F1_9ACTN|nr:MULTISPECIES: hypothetical protein [Streptomyces]KUH40077.1 hypothetical protein ATE80_03325 [Streptomyces kanasensis]UUS32771.1 hypothetical protein NRO40_19425 [Streptomyces changanensis]
MPQQPHQAREAAPADPLHWCPSGSPDRPEAVVLGVRSGPDGRVDYLAAPLPAAEVVAALPDGVPPTRVLRFASHCVSGCANRVGTACGLADRMLALPSAEGAPVPRCHLRAHCKWWHQTGVAACHRCPAVATAPLADDTLSALVADPSTTREHLAAHLAATGPGAAGR